MKDTDDDNHEDKANNNEDDKDGDDNENNTEDENKNSNGKRNRNKNRKRRQDKNTNWIDLFKFGKYTTQDELNETLKHYLNINSINNIKEYRNTEIDGSNIVNVLLLVDYIVQPMLLYQDLSNNFILLIHNKTSLIQGYTSNNSHKYVSHNMYDDVSSIMNSTLHDNFWHEIVHYEFYAGVDEYKAGMTNIDNETTNTNSHSFDFEYKSNNQSNYDRDAIECGYEMTDTSQNSNSHVIINIAIIVEKHICVGYY